MEEAEETISTITEVTPSTEVGPDVTKESDLSQSQDEQETVNFDTTPTETTINTEENVLNLGGEDDDDHSKGFIAPPDDMEDDDHNKGFIAPPDDMEDDDHKKSFIGSDEEPQLEDESQLEYEQQLEGEEYLEDKGEGEEPQEVKPVEEKKKPKAKPEADDVIDGIVLQEYSAIDINIDEIRKSIAGGTVDNIFGQVRLELGPPITMTPESTVCEEEEEGEESEEISILAELGLQLKEKEPINRENYEEEYHQLKEAEKFLKRKNGLLHKKLAEYYLRRKVTRVFADVNIEIYEELLDKYEKKMEDLFEIRNRTLREKEAVDNELLDITHLRDDQADQLNRNFQDMQDREYEIGHGLVDTKTGKIISDKAIERLLHRQKIKSEDIAKIRLAYIKRRDRVREIDQKIKSLETIGGTLHLMDFEQLRMENQNFIDKIEERDEELMRLRDRFSKAMMCLAHIREKINIIEFEIGDMCETREIETRNAFKTREELNNLKMQRDFNRSQRLKLKEQTGILTIPRLLNDMEFGVKSREILEGILIDLKEKNNDSKYKLMNIRKHIIQTEQQQLKQIKKPFDTLSTPKYTHQRPTLTYPVAPRIAFLKSKIQKINKV